MRALRYGHSKSSGPQRIGGAIILSTMHSQQSVATCMSDRNFHCDCNLKHLRVLYIVTETFYEIGSFKIKMDLNWYFSLIVQKTSGPRCQGPSRKYLVAQSRNYTDREFSFRENADIDTYHNRLSTQRWKFYRSEMRLWLQSIKFENYGRNVRIAPLQCSRKNKNH